ALALRGVRTEGLAIADTADAALQHRLEAAARITGVGEGRDPAAQALLDAQARGVEQIVVREHGATRVREPEDPLAEGQTVEKAAHGGELEVAVRVDETGEEECVAEVDVGTVSRGRRVGARTDVRDPSFALDHRAVGDGRGGDREHPPRVVPGHASNAPVRDPCRIGSYRSSSRTPMERARSRGNAMSATCCRE